MTDYGQIFADSTERLEVYSAITMVGKEQLKEFEPQVRAYLDHDDEELVVQAINTLGFRWGLPDFKAESERMWRTQANGATREAAFLSWMSYFALTKDVEAAGIVMQVIRGSQYSPRMRGTALGVLGRIFEMKPREFSHAALAVTDAESAEEADAQIPWGPLDEFCEEFGIEVVG